MHPHDDPPTPHRRRGSRAPGNDDRPGFTVSDEQAARIASSRTPIWITHGTSDPVLPLTNGRVSSQRLRDASIASGVDAAYETRPILHWLLEQ
ncbi:hypothetical protein AB0392_58100 [Nonomuraea angiospora]|uniref:hypothetical protein n=1 Tax=Nonomuraea angiospora TaxID=46172 RepID=UPI00344DE38E